MAFLEIGEYIINTDTIAYVRFTQKPTGSCAEAEVMFVSAQPPEELLRLRFQDEQAEQLRRALRTDMSS